MEPRAMERYRSRLERDLPRWQAQGWVSKEGAGAIRKELEAAGRGVGLSATLAILGAVLIGFAAMSFVAAHWQEMSKLARLALLFAGLWSAYGLAGRVVGGRGRRVCPAGGDGGGRVVWGENV